MKLLLLLIALLVGSGSLRATAAESPAAPTPAPMRLACVGDSITFGSGTSQPTLESYPAQLQRMLDPHAWVVGNFGVSGATLMNGGDKPYRRQSAFADALAFAPNLVVIMLGTNDSKPQNWSHHAPFVADYRDLIARFKALPSSPRIFICRPPAVVADGKYGINTPNVLAELPLIDEIARAEHTGLIDQYITLESHPELQPDHVHPNAAGANRLARAVYRALTGQEFAGRRATSPSRPPRRTPASPRTGSSGR